MLIWWDDDVHHVTFDRPSAWTHERRAHFRTRTRLAIAAALVAAAVVWWVAL